MKRLALALVLAAPSLACATIPESAGGGDALPNAAAGPFRAITSTELGNLRSAPNALEDDEHATRDGSVVDLDGDPATLPVFGYFAANAAGASGPPDRILRYGAIDGRSFDRAAEVVLTATEAWEGGTVDAPAALRVDDGIWLYYAAKGGVGLAKSADGKAFTRAGDAGAPGLVLRDARSAGVVRQPDGTFVMFFEITSHGVAAIAEASSPDGEHWTLPTLVLEPTTGSYDERGAGSPAPLLATSATGRAITRVYYTATDADGNVTIGLAARFGDNGFLERSTSPVFGTANALAPHHPSVVVFRDFTLLFATEDASSRSSSPAIACGVAPGDVSLPTPRPR